MITETTVSRRAFVVNALGSLGILPAVIADAPQSPEVPTYWADVPPGATLFGLIVFTAPEPVEMTIAAGKSIELLTGRFDGQRVAEYSWRNASTRPERVAVRAKALAGDRELHAAKVQFISQENLYVGFGRRATPEKLSDRSGGYPYEAVFVGFFVFEGQDDKSPEG